VEHFLSAGRFQRHLVNGDVRVGERLGERAHLRACQVPAEDQRGGVRDDAVSEAPGPRP
jgi:hypothetical protein